MVGLPLFGLWFVWHSWRLVRRYNDVQCAKTDDGDTFVWKDLNGKVRQDSVDPRIKWDIDDRLEGG